jgi:phospholipid/cholesterol/gamma-HCH transport system substrate-binding protein
MTTSREAHSRHSTQLLGGVGLLVIAVVVALLIATYLKAFKPVVPVTVTSDRAGLLLDKGARVRVSGVPVGEVRSTKLQPDGTVKVEVALDEDKAGRVPSDVMATIRGTTVFGSKFVDLEVPQRASARRAVRAGDVISSSGVTVEANDVFAHGMKVLEAVKPTELNSTLTAMSTALDGRGEKFGQFFTDWDHYLGRVDSHLPALEADLRSSAKVLDTYADVAPQLIDTADNFGTTSDTLVTNAEEFDALLSGIVPAAESTKTFLNAAEAPLVAFNREWLPVTGLGAEYSPEIPCVVHDLHEHLRVFNKVYAYNDHSIEAAVGFLPSQNPYRASKNLPKLVRGVGPACYSDPSGQGRRVPHINFDDGTAGIYSAQASEPVVPADQPIGLYFELIRSFFGESGYNAFLQGLPKETEK